MEATVEARRTIALDLPFAPGEAPPLAMAPSRGAWIPEPPSESATLLLAIQRASSDPSIDIDKMIQLYGLYKDIQARSAMVDYNTAFAAMQPELPIIEENGAITNKAGDVQSTYAEWEDINEAIKPVLAKHGFGLSFRIKREGDQITVKAVLSHKGHAEETELTLPFDTSGSKNNVQSIGSSTSYGQRYTAKALLNLTSRKREDDDGRRGGGSLRDQPAAVSAAIAAINLCDGEQQLLKWNADSREMVLSLPAAEQRPIIAHYQLRLKRAREAKAAN